MQTKKRPTGQAQFRNTTPEKWRKNYKMPNEAILPKSTIPFPGVHLAESSEVPEIVKPHGWVRFGIRIGMFMSQPPPKVWAWNPSVVTLLLLMGGLIASAGYYIGHQAAVIENIQTQATAAQQAANKAVQIMNQQDSEPTPTPKRGK